MFEFFVAQFIYLLAMRMRALEVKMNMSMMYLGKMKRSTKSFASKSKLEKKNDLNHF